eukprot:NODE_155_length_16773_cov_0.488785.p2 type:complete len:537 gc:universal NODE_155_length_16773_cov_0.488785:10562-8952(-)
MEEDLSNLHISAVNDHIVSKWETLGSKPLFSTKDVRALVKDISDGVQKMLNLNQENQKPNYAIVGARGTGKTWLMRNMNSLLNIYFEEKKLNAQSFYSDMSQPLSKLTSPFDKIQNWLEKKGCNLKHDDYDQKLDWFAALRAQGFRLFFFADEIHHVYELNDKTSSQEIIYQLYVIGKSTTVLGFISSSSYKLDKYAFSDKPDYANLNNTVYTRKYVYPLREANQIANYCGVALGAAADILWKTGGIPRYMNSVNDECISEKDFGTYINKNDTLASILTMFYLKYDDSNPLSIITLKWAELFTSQSLPGEFYACISEYQESYFFHSSGIQELQLLLPFTITYIVNYFKLKSDYLDFLVFNLLTEKKFTSLGHYMESVILKHSDDLQIGEYREQEGTELVDGVYQITGAEDNDMDGFVVNERKIHIIQIKCGDKKKRWTDGYNGKIPLEHKIDDDNIAAMTNKQARNMKDILTKAARNWQKIKKKYTDYTLGKFYFITTQKVTDDSLELARNTYLLNEKIQDVVLIGYEDIKRVIEK